MSTVQPRPPAVRKASLKDAQAIAELGTHVFTVTFGSDLQPTDLQTYLSESYSIEATMKELENPDKDMLVGTDDKDQILGFALLTKGSSVPCIKDLPKSVQLQRIYLHPSAQGRGVGRLLVEGIEAEARKQGFENLWLTVYEKHHKGIKFYERLGFKAVGTTEFVTGLEVQMDLVMLKSL